MKRPEIADKKVLKYVESLEKKLEVYSSKGTKINAYIAFKLFIDVNCELLKAVRILSKTGEEQEYTDREIARTVKFAGELPEHLQKLENLEAKLLPEELVQAEEVSAGLLEEILIKNGKA